MSKKQLISKCKYFFFFFELEPNDEEEVFFYGNRWGTFRCRLTKVILPPLHPSEEKKGKQKQEISQKRFIRVEY